MDNDLLFEALQSRQQATAAVQKRFLDDFSARVGALEASISDCRASILQLQSSPPVNADLVEQDDGTLTSSADFLQWRGRLPAAAADPRSAARPVAEAWDHQDDGDDDDDASSLDSHHETLHARFSLQLQAFFRLPRIAFKDGDHAAHDSSPPVQTSESPSVLSHLKKMLPLSRASQAVVLQDPPQAPAYDTGRDDFALTPGPLPFWRILLVLFWDVIHPFSQFRFYWDLVMLLVIVWITLVTPVLVCFDINIKCNTPFGGMELLVDALLWCDVLVHTRTGFTEGKHKLQADHMAIFQRYAKGWLAADVVTSIPFLTLIPLYPNDHRGPRLFLRLLRMFRLVRVVHYVVASKLVRQIEQHLSRVVIRISRLITTALTVLHLFACWFVFIGNVLADDRGGGTWLDANKLHNATSFEKYICSLYWAMYTMTTVGYGNIIIVTVTEKFSCMICMLIGVTEVTYFMGSVTTLISALSSTNAKISERRRQVEDFIRSNKIPPSLAAKMRNFYNYILDKQMHQDDVEIIKGLSESLRREVVMKLYATMIEKVPFFRGKHPQFITQVVTHMKMQFYSTGDYVVKQGDVGTEMYFIAEGILEVRMAVEESQQAPAEGSVDGISPEQGSSDDPPPSYKMLQVLTTGQHFGEYSCLTGQVRSASVVATTFCELYALSRENLENVINDWPELGEEFKIFRQQIQTPATGPAAVPTVERSSASVTSYQAFQELMNRMGSTGAPPAAMVTGRGSTQDGTEANAADGNLNARSTRADIAGAPELIAASYEPSADEEASLDPGCAASGIELGGVVLEFSRGRPPLLRSSSSAGSGLLSSIQQQADSLSPHALPHEDVAAAVLRFRARSKKMLQEARGPSKQQLPTLPAATEPGESSTLADSGSALPKSPRGDMD